MLFQKQKRNRETPVFISPFQSFRLSPQCMVLSCPFLSDCLVRKIMPGSVLRIELGSSGKNKGVCSHSVVGAFYLTAGIHFRPCCVSRCLRKSTFRWKPLPHRSQPKGLKPVCFRLWVMRLELWLKAFPHTWHLWGFSPASRRWERESEKEAMCCIHRTRANRKCTLGLKANQKDFCVITKLVILTENMQLGAPEHQLSLHYSWADLNLAAPPSL